MAPGERTDGGREDGRTDMDKPISLRLRQGIKIYRRGCNIVFYNIIKDIVEKNAFKIAL